MGVASLADDPRSWVLGIGCGNGAVLVDAVQAYPDFQFIGIDMYQPMLAHLLQQLATQAITHVKIFHGDIHELLQHLPAQRLHTVQIFSPIHGLSS